MLKNWVESIEFSSQALKKLVHRQVEHHPLGDIDRPGLLVIDAQKWFFDEVSPLFLPETSKILPQMNLLISNFRTAKFPVYFTRHIDRNDSSMVRWWGRSIQRENPLSDLAIAPHQDKVIEKHTYDSFFETQLETHLREDKVISLVIIGVLTHLCVDTTARSAFSRGFFPIIPVDAVGSKNDVFHTTSLLSLAHGFSTLTDTPALTTCLSKLSS